MNLQKNRAKVCVGLFLMGIGLAMFVFGIIYLCSTNMNYSWCGFGVIYTLSIVGILMNKKLKEKLGVKSGSKMMKPWSLVILGIGLALSFALGASTGLGDRGVILGVLITVGLHFIPFPGKGAKLFALVVVINGLLGFLLSGTPVVVFVFIDGLIKIVTGSLYVIQRPKTAVAA